MAQTRLGAMKANAARFGMPFDEYRLKVESGLKRCTKCKEWKPTRQFNVDQSRGDSLSSKCHGCSRVPERKSMKGRPSAFKGHSHTPEARAKMGAAKKGMRLRLGIKHTPEAKAKIAATTRQRTPRGAGHYAYSHGQAQRNKSDRRTVEYRQWRDSVFSRDGYSCQACGDDRGGNLQAHHIKSFSNHPGLRYDVSNGTTLCQDCHEKIHLKPIPMPSDLKRRRKHRA